MARMVIAATQIALAAFGVADELWYYGDPPRAAAAI